MRLAQLRQQLLASKQRVLLHLQGEHSQCVNWLHEQLQTLPELSLLWFGEEPAATPQTDQKSALEKRLKQYKKHLGQERDLLVIDTYSGFNPDALGALSGIVKLGGICVLITPENDLWPQYPDPELTRLCSEPYQITEIEQYYTRRLAHMLKQDDFVVKVNLESKTEFVPELSDRASSDRTAEQTALLKSLLPQLQQTTKNSFASIIQADRGRGKSALMGLVCANILCSKQGQEHTEITLTAPLTDSVNTLFEHCEQELQNREVDFLVQGNGLTTEFGKLTFIAPDQLMLTELAADLLLVDEAAAIPMQMLKPVLTRYKRALFATTVQGYEGTGRGFEYKLKPFITRVYDDVAKLTLNQPIRWYQGDMLERVSNRMLGLDGHISQLPDTAPDGGQFTVWTKAQLIEQESKLMEIFSLLINAHYRTTPGDLRQMLDGPTSQIVTVEHQGKTIAAALLIEEGNLPEPLSELIWQGRRRPRGHLFPQSLMAHAGFKQAGGFRYSRVVRIAVHPQIQGRGIGTSLLANIETWARHQQIDFLCTSFGCEAKLLEFWQRAGLEPARLGLKQEASTGEYSVLMFKPLKTGATAFFEQVSQRFWQTWQVERNANLRVMDFPSPNTDLSLAIEAQDLLDLHCFSEHFRSLDSCLLALNRLVYTSSVEVDNKADIGALLRAKCSAKYTDKQLINKYNLAGEKAFVQRLREEVKQALAQHTAVKVNT